MDEQMDKRHKRIWGKEQKEKRDETEKDREDLLSAIMSHQRVEER